MSNHPADQRIEDLHINAPINPTIFQSINQPASPLDHEPRISVHLPKQDILSPEQRSMNQSINQSISQSMHKIASTPSIPMHCLSPEEANHPSSHQSVGRTRSASIGSVDSNRPATDTPLEILRSPSMHQPANPPIDDSLDQPMKSLLSAPTGARTGYTVPLLVRRPSSNPSSNQLNNEPDKADEPLMFNKVKIEYAPLDQTVNQPVHQEMTDLSNLLWRALQLRRQFVWSPEKRDTREFDIRVNPPFKAPPTKPSIDQSTDVSSNATSWKSSNHSFQMVDGVYCAWEGSPVDMPDEIRQLIMSSESASQSATTLSTSQLQILSNEPSNNATLTELRDEAQALFGDQANHKAKNHSIDQSSSSSPSLSSPTNQLIRQSTNKTGRSFIAASRAEYASALQFMLELTGSGPIKSFCHTRLMLLESRFTLHETLNGDLESLAQRVVPHRDFYNVRKIDNHVHHSAAFNQKHLLRFIKHKLKTEGDEKVIVRDGKTLTLSEVFQSLNLTPYDLSVDTLDMHADKTFHRFDKFNLKYNPIGESRLREIFLKYNNLTKGKYLAQITKQVFSDLEANKYQFAEYRLSIYGSSPSEWTILSDWVCDFELFCYNCRWMIQIPRLYAVYKAAGKIDNFGQMLENIFAPLFEVSINPSCNPALHRFLSVCVGFDMVDDESVREKSFAHSMPIPSEYRSELDPPYAYFAYYVYANLYVLNTLRESKGLNTFALRPHAGEAGDAEHLACTFLLARSINHGLVLQKSPALQYLYYLAQIGISMSPLSNNLLFLEYDKNPFPRFFKRGLNVTLSTDDPLMIHVTREPLVEEYSVAAQVWKLTSVDMSEIARNSVLQSGWEHPYKTHFLGNNYWRRGLQGNDIRQTNVPAIRVQYRHDLLNEEMDVLSRYSDHPFKETLIDPIY